MTTSVEAQRSLAPAPAVAPWGFWATTAWAVAAFAAWLAAQMISVAILLTWWNVNTGGLADIRQALDHGFAVALIVLAATPAFILVILLAVRLARASPAAYLAFVPPPRRDLVLGLALLVVLLPLGDLSTWLSGRDIVHPFMVHSYVTAREGGFWAVFALACAVVVAAPLTEEIAFRAFIYRGWSASPLGPAGTIALTSAIWAAMHLQYEMFYLVQIFGLGLVFGWLRQRSGSTLLPLLLHVLVNFTALLQTAIVVAVRS